MSEFKLSIVTPDSVVFDGMAENVIVCTYSGYVGILKDHAPYAAALKPGKAQIKIDGEWKNAACMGGIVTADKDGVKIAANTFEWADSIDVERAENAMHNAERIIESSADNKQIDKARAKLLRAMTRIGVANNK